MARVQHIIPDAVKTQAEFILRKQGFTPTVATNLFYVEVINYGGLPFNPTPISEIPNELTLKTIRDSKKGKNIVKCKNKEEFFQMLKQ